MLDSNKVKEMLKEEDIIKLCCYLQGSDEYLRDAYGNPIFSTVLDHPESSSGSLKEYYYTQTKLFRCYTRGETYDVFEMVRRAKGLDTFKEAYDFVVDFFKLSDFFIDDNTEEELTDDWDIFQKIKDYTREVSLEPPVIKSIPENLLEYFYPLAAPREWIREGISPEIMRYFNIRVDSALHKIIIPHRDINGNLIGIRGRTYDPKELDEGKKYMPVFIEGDMYNHPLGKNLFGLYENQETIRKIKKVCVFEAEKSVLQIGSIFGIHNNWSVAVCGSNISEDQIKISHPYKEDENFRWWNKEHEEIFIEECVKLANRYIYDRYMPDKAIDLLDEAFSVDYKSRLNNYNSNAVMTIYKEDELICDKVSGVAFTNYINSDEIADYTIIYNLNTQYKGEEITGETIMLKLSISSPHIYTEDNEIRVDNVVKNESNVILFVILIGFISMIGVGIILLCKRRR